MFTEGYVYWNETNPGDNGLTIMRYIYNQAFQKNDMGLGSAIGMVLLLILLCTKAIKPEQISGVSSFFLNHLALFFLPPSIAIMAVGDDVLSKWPLLLFLCIAFTLVTIAVGGRVTQLFIRKQEYRENLALRVERLTKRASRNETNGGEK